MSRPGSRGGLILQGFFRVVLYHGHLLHHDLFFHGQVLIVEARPAQHGAEKRQEGQGLATGYQSVQGGQFTASVGVDLTAHGVQACGQRRGVELLGAFEQHVFE